MYWISSKFISHSFERNDRHGIWDEDLRRISRELLTIRKIRIEKCVPNCPNIYTQFNSRQMVNHLWWWNEHKCLVGFVFLVTVKTVIPLKCFLIWKINEFNSNFGYKFFNTSLKCEFKTLFVYTKFKMLPFEAKINKAKHSQCI